MHGSKFLLSFWLSTATFCILQVLMGPGGITDTAQLKVQSEKLDRRLEELQADNNELSARFRALMTSSEAIELEARSLGWFRSGDVPVRILSGGEFALPPRVPDLTSVSAIPAPSESTALFFRLAWPLLMLVYWSLLHLAARLWPRNENTQSPPSGRELTLTWRTESGLDFFRK